MISLLNKPITSLTQDELIRYAYELGTTLELSNHDSIINDLIMRQDDLFVEAYDEGHDDGYELAKKVYKEDMTCAYQEGFDDGYESAGKVDKEIKDALTCAYNDGYAACKRDSQGDYKQGYNDGVAYGLVAAGYTLAKADKINK